MNTADIKAFFLIALYTDMIEDFKNLATFELYEPKNEITEINLFFVNIKLLKNANLSIKEIEDCIVIHHQERL